MDARQLATLAKQAKTDVEFSELVNGADGVLTATINYMPGHPSIFQGQALVGTYENHRVVVFTNNDAP